MSDTSQSSQQKTGGNKKRKLSEIRIGEFIAALDVLPPTKLKPALKVSQDLGLPLGRTLVVRGLLTNEEVNNLLDLHSLFKRGSVEFSNVSEAYSMSKRRGWQAREALSALGCAVDDIETVRLGELLLNAELLSEDSLNDALKLQSYCGLPLGRILCVDSNLSEEIVNSALEYQNGVRTNSMEYQDAIDKLKMMPLLMNTDSIRPVIEMNIKDLLVGSRICHESDLVPAQSYAEANKISLEKALFRYEWVDINLISAAVALSSLIKRGYVSAQDAIEFLSSVKEGNSLEQAKKNAERSPELKIIEGDLNLYKFLIASGFLTPSRIRKLTKAMIAKDQEFAELTGIEIDKSSSRKEVREAIIQCFATDTMLAKVLTEFDDVHEDLVYHARNLVDVIVLGGATVEQALLSFAWCRKDLETIEE